MPHACPNTGAQTKARVVRLVQQRSLGEEVMMIITKQPSIEDAKLQRELIAHIEPVDEDLLADEDRVKIVPDEEGAAKEDEES